MESRATVPTSPRSIGVICAVAATALGLAYMAAAGAPSIYLTVNALALVMGLALLGVLRTSPRPLLLRGGVAVGLGALLLATALLGQPVEGVSRWIRVGGISLQISLIVLPAMLVAFARRRDLLATIGVILAAAALAVQPDRAMAGVLVCGLAALALHRRDRWTIAALVAAAVGFAITLVRPDPLPAVPYVDQIFYTAFDVHAMAGVAVLCGSLLLVIPALVGYRLDPQNREVFAVFGAAWLGMLAAAALGNYPTPLVGYGGSAILGYALSLTPMPGPVRSPATATELVEAPAHDRRDGVSDLRMGAVLS